MEIYCVVCQVGNDSLVRVLGAYNRRISAFSFPRALLRCLPSEVPQDVTDTLNGPFIAPPSAGDGPLSQNFRHRGCREVTKLPHLLKPLVRVGCIELLNPVQDPSVKTFDIHVFIHPPDPARAAVLV